MRTSTIFSNIFAFIIALAIVFRGTIFLAEYSDLYYTVIIVGAILVVFIDSFFSKLKINVKALSFLFICLLSILLNEIDPIFKPWERYIGFVMLLILLGPVDNSDYSITLKTRTLTYLQYLLIIFTVLSLLTFIFQLPLAFIKGNLFNGLSVHSMTLGPLASFAVIFCLDNLIKKRKNSTINLIISTILFVLCIFVVILSASRAAIGGTLIAIVAYLSFMYHRKKASMISFLLVLSVMLGFLTIYNPGGVIDNVIEKIETKQVTENFTSGRDAMWKDRITDFEESPILGVGFSSMKETTNSKVDFIEDSQESGSGWLMVLSSTGILGLIAFLFLLVPPLIRIWKYYSEYSLYGALIVFFIIHTFIEGYTLAFGNSLCAIMWLSIGLSSSLKKQAIK